MRRIRAARAEDAAELATLRAAVWPAAYRGIVDDRLLDATIADPDNARRYRSMIEGAPAENLGVFVCLDDERVVGIATAGHAREPGIDPAITGELQGIYTHTDVWGTGAGRALVHTSLSHLARAGYREAMLRVFEQNVRARRFYERLGWALEGDRQTSRRWRVPEVRYRIPLPIVRAPERKDAPRMAEVHVRAWQDGYAGKMPPSYLDGLTEQVPRRTEQWVHLITDPGAAHHLVVESRAADQAEQIVGIATVGPSRDENAEAATGELLQINVAADAWGTAAGQALHDAVVDLLRRDGFTHATLWVLDTNNRARRFYERNGWVADGATKDDDMRGFTLHEVRYVLDISSNA